MQISTSFYVGYPFMTKDYFKNIQYSIQNIQQREVAKQQMVSTREGKFYLRNCPPSLRIYGGSLLLKNQLQPWVFLQRGAYALLDKVRGNQWEKTIFSSFDFWYTRFLNTCTGLGYVPALTIKINSMVIKQPFYRIFEYCRPGGTF